MNARKNAHPDPGKATEVRGLTVFYDSRCGTCRRCRNWLDKQPKYFEVRFTDFRSDKARRILPGIDKLDPAKEMVAMSDSGGIYRGAGAWVMCLYATKNWRAWSLRLASPALLPHAERFYKMISDNRYRISDWLENVPGMRSP